MYVDAWFDRDPDCIEIAERINGKRIQKFFPQNIIFIIKIQKENCSIFLENLTRVSCNNTKQFPKEKQH